VPAGIERPKTVTAPQDWTLTRAKQAWPRVVDTAAKQMAPASSAEAIASEQTVAGEHALTNPQATGLPPATPTAVATTRSVRAARLSHGKAKSRL
jgi:hypothetical protein